MSGPRPAERRDAEGADPPAPVSVLGYAVAPLDLEAAVTRVLALVATARRDGRDRQVVTLNPEIVVQAEDDPRMAAALRGADLRVADGVGIVWAARRRGARLPGRVPGVELASAAMARGGADLRVYFFGGEPGVAARAAAAATVRFGVEVAGHHHGYVADGDELEAVVAEIGAARPDLLLAGLGPRQERFLAEHRGRFGGAVGIGVGGTLDVLAGRATRTPAWTRRLGVEWLWRVGLDPKRWHRIPRLVRFVRLVLARGRG